MATRNLNKVMLIGNLTREPEIRYTPQGNAVASFVVATNREWVSEGEKRQAADFHNVVAWNKLAEICGQLLGKGTKVYVEGRLQTRNWEDAGGIRKYKTEVVIDDMMVLARGKAMGEEEDMEYEYASQDQSSETPAAAPATEEVNFDDLDFDLDEMSGDNGGTK
jgi:single-strand DNA-binding protein